MQANAYSKYALRDLHQSIGLVDRKINYCRDFEKFPSLEDRESALRKLAHKRAALSKAANVLTELGVSYDPKAPLHSYIHLVEGERNSLAPGKAEESKFPAPRRKRRVLLK